MADTKISQLSEKQNLGNNDLFIIATNDNNYKVKGSTIKTFAQDGLPTKISDLTDIEIDSETLAGGQLLKYDATSQKWINESDSTAGENLTTTGATNVGLYSTTTSGILKFKSLVAGSGISLTANEDGNSVEVDTNISNASTSTTGLLTSTDWNTFNSKQDSQSIVADTSSTSATISSVAANTRYTFSEALTALTLTAVVDSNLESEIQFTTDAGGCTLTVPNTLKWIGNNTISANKEYVLSIKNNIAVLWEIS